MPPTFPTFRPMSIEDQGMLNEAKSAFLGYSDTHFANLLAWGDGSVNVSRLNGNLLIELPDYLDGTPIITLLGKNKLNDTAKQILEFISLDFDHFELRLIPEEVARELSNSHFNVSEDIDNHDYVISVNDFVSMAGSAYSQIRRSIRLFEKSVNEFEVVELDQKDNEIARQLSSLFEAWVEIKSSAGAQVSSLEQEAFLRCLRYAQMLDVRAFGGKCEGDLQAFWIVGQVSQSEIVSHFEKYN